jgi:glycine cleavage system transcriptional repressor
MMGQLPGGAARRRKRRNMKTHALLSALGRDRIGVAGDLTAALARRHIEIEGSRMTALKGKFALLVQVCGEGDDVTGLSRDLSKMGGDLGFELHLDALEAKPAPAPAPEKARPFLIECFSPGPAGLNAVTRVLHNHRINIEELETETSAAPCSSRIAFYMKARIAIPSSVSIERLRVELRGVEDKHNLDIMVEPSSPAAGRYRPATANSV